MHDAVSVALPIAPPAAAAPAAWPAVFSLTLGVFGLVTAEFLPASLLTPMAQSLGLAEGLAGQAVTVTAADLTGQSQVPHAHLVLTVPRRN